MDIIWPWLLPLIPLTWGLIDVVRLKNFLEDRGWLKLALERSELERLNIIRAIIFALIIFFTILASGKTQLIVGIIGMIMGGLIMYYFWYWGWGEFKIERRYSSQISGFDYVYIISSLDVRQHTRYVNLVSRDLQPNSRYRDSRIF